MAFWLRLVGPDRLSLLRLPLPLLVPPPRLLMPLPAFTTRSIRSAVPRFQS
uniref:Uncharacterized protein n=1 Tax=Picea glauca TaxID=3330 RepID=A0A124GP03_PICGL|nr:hypothetical protein ABT39_MTgene295 [Picea glauca]QHR90708.1 hypothetical protein Q903MT_gene4734 [Picea sitchensis]